MKIQLYTVNLNPTLEFNLDMPALPQTDMTILLEGEIDVTVGERGESDWEFIGGPPSYFHPEGVFNVPVTVDGIDLNAPRERHEKVARHLLAHGWHPVSTSTPKRSAPQRNSESGRT